MVLEDASRFGTWAESDSLAVSDRTSTIPTSVEAHPEAPEPSRVDQVLSMDPPE